MKMKKLTALALAGVLCLGMSITAFAADSVTAEVGSVTVKDKKGNEVEVTGNGRQEISEGKYPAIADTVAKWEDEETGSEAIYTSIETALKKMSDEDKANFKEDELKALKSKDTTFVVVDQFDLDFDIPEGGEAVISLKVTGLKNANGEEVKAGDRLYMMHYVDMETGWALIPCDVEENNETGELFVKQTFTSLSPIAFIDIVADGGSAIDPSNPTNPSNPTDPTNPSNPTVNGNGSITADQLADLIVQRLQRNANTTNVVRSAGKPSPKTGE